MKRILMVFVSLIFIICLISCNEEEKVEEINIKFVIEENIYDIKKEVNYIVNIDDIPNINEEDIEGIYYDSNYSSKYNNEVLGKDTILYVRRVKENIEVTFIVGNIEEVVSMKGNSVVSLDNIPNISEEDIEGIYYDKEYTSEYKGEIIQDDIVLYMKIIDIKKWLISKLNRLLTECESVVEYDIIFIKQKIQKAQVDIYRSEDDDYSVEIYKKTIENVDNLFISGEKLIEFKQKFCDIANEIRVEPIGLESAGLAYYYGTFNESKVFSPKVDGWGFGAPLVLEIGKYTFKFTEHSIRVMYDNKISRLDKAYEAKAITDDDLDIIYEMFLITKW